MAGIQLYAQNDVEIQKIDSLNNISYEKKIETSAFNLNKYLKNAEDSKRINYKKGIADSYSSISLIYFYKSQYDLSSEYFFNAIKLYESLNLMGEAGNLYSLYGYRLRHTDIAKSLQYMQTGIKMAEKAGAQIQLMGMYDNYGLVKEANKEYDSAFFYFNKALKMKQNAKDEIGIPYSLNKIATLNATLGNFDEAKKNLDDAYQIRLKLNDKVGIAENLSFYGSYYELLNDTDNAINYFEQALQASKDAGYRWLTYRIYESLSKNLEKKNEFQKALGYYKQYSSYKDSIYNLEATTNKNEIEIQFETEKKEKEILQQRAEIAEARLKVEQKNILLLGLVGLAIILGLIGYQFYRVQKIRNKQLEKENLLKDALIKIETQNKLQEQRLQISRDLHDNIGSQLTFIISSIDNLKYVLKDENPEMSERLKEISYFTKNTITELRDTIWAMNKENISFTDLKIRINNFIENAKLATKGIQFDFEMDEQIEDEFTFSALEGINIYRVIQESINNSIKHAQPTEVKIRFAKLGQKFTIEVSDNGKGLDENNICLGNGLHNMHKRIAELGGELNISSNDGKGTILKINI